MPNVLAHAADGKVAFPFVLYTTTHNRRYGHAWYTPERRNQHGANYTMNMNVHGTWSMLTLGSSSGWSPDGHTMGRRRLACPPSVSCAEHRRLAAPRHPTEDTPT